MLAAGAPTYLQLHALSVSSASAFGHGGVTFVVPGLVWSQATTPGVSQHLTPRWGPRHSGRGTFPVHTERMHRIFAHMLNADTPLVVVDMLSFNGVWDGGIVL